MIVAWVPVVAILVGLLMWLLASKPVVQKMGEYIFVCGVFVTLLAAGRKTIELLGSR